MQLKGKVVFWRDDKGFGFVECSQTKQKYFFHIRDNQGADARPSVNDELLFNLAKDKQNRDIASPWRYGVEKVSKPVSSAISKPSHINYAKQIGLLFRVSYLAALFGSLFFGIFLYALPFLYIEASLFTYWLYQADKKAAIAGHGNRLNEESLQLYSFIGGWPGALWAQKKLAHKRSKKSFRREFGLVVLANCLLLLWLLSPLASNFLKQMAFLN